MTQDSSQSKLCVMLMHACNYVLTCVCCAKTRLTNLIRPLCRTALWEIQTKTMNTSGGIFTTCLGSILANETTLYVSLYSIIIFLPFLSPACEGHLHNEVKQPTEL